MRIASIVLLIACSKKPPATAMVAGSAFARVAEYTGVDDETIGGRYKHQATGFTVDVLRMDTAPQALLYVNTLPTSDRGEPHTQEHLLIQKGERGRKMSGLDSMELATTTPYTLAWRTMYTYRTEAGVDAFWKLTDARIDSLLHPDYTDEEVRREVRNFGVVDEKGELRLVEKGTVYNEMTRTYEGPLWRMRAAVHEQLYGKGHTLAFDPGGTPAGIRSMLPEHIRAYHKENYHLANMGIVVVLPRSESIDGALARLDAMLKASPQPGQVTRTEADIPPPASTAKGAVRLVPYPAASAEAPGAVYFVWPATRDLPLAERELMELVLSGLASDESSVLYDTLIKKHRFGKSVEFDVLSMRGLPVQLRMVATSAEHLNEAGAQRIRAVVMDEIRRFAGDARFTADLRHRLLERRRQILKARTQSPGFGDRDLGTSLWLEWLDALGKVEGTKKSLLFTPQLAWVEKQLEQPSWKQVLERWGLLEEPAVLVSRPDPDLRKQEAAERAERIRQETARVVQQYGSLQAYREAYDRKTAELDAVSKHTPLPGFTKSPPMTEDDTLVWEQRTLARGVPLVASTFAGSAGGSVGIAFDLHSVPEGDARLLSALPLLLSEAGVIENGQPVSFEQMQQRQRQEILSINISTSVSAFYPLAELVATGVGNTAQEVDRALYWLQLQLLHPDWREANVPRLLEVLDREQAAVRGRVLRADETWVKDPAAAWRKQSDPLFIHTSSFMTRAHDLYRLRWQLRDAKTPAEAKALTTYFAGLAKLKTRDAMTAALKEKLPDSMPMLAREAQRDLAQLLADIPDETLATDWAYLCRAINDDVLAPAKQTLAALEALRQRVLKTTGARTWASGNNDTLATTQAALSRMIDTLPATTPNVPAYSGRRVIAERLAMHQPGEPMHVGLVSANMQTGVHVHSAASTRFTELDDASLLRYLSSNVLSGGGAHSLFMRTNAAGLAYSNGVRANAWSGRVIYYAERCPDLAATMRFAMNEVAHAEASPALGPYALALAFGGRTSEPYDKRAEAMAQSLAEGATPDRVRAFREKLIALEKRYGDALGAELVKHLPEAIGPTMPVAKVKGTDSVSFVIGPHSQLDSWERYLKEQTGAPLHRLYPRDYWVP